METKQCTKCGFVKPATPEFFTTKTKSGNLYICGKCRECSRAEGRAYWGAKANSETEADRAARLKRVRERAKKRTPEQRQVERSKLAAKRGKSYTPGGPAAVRERLYAGSKSGFYKKRGSAFERHMDRLAEWNAIEAFNWWIRHRAHPETVAAFYADRPWENPRLTDAERYRLRYSMDAQFNAGERLRRQIKKASQRDGVAETIRSAIRRNGSSPFVVRELGYTITELRQHLERQFHEGMSWDAFLAGEIHIDHIKPKASFDLSKHEEWLECWSLSNLRPLWASENLEKSAKQLFLL